jgi:hypothetical protein
VAAACGDSEGGPPAALTLIPAPAVAKLQQLPAKPTTVVPLAPRGGRAALQVAFAARHGVPLNAGALVLRNAAGTRLPAASVLLEDDIRVSRPSDAVRNGLLGRVPDPLLPLPTTTSDLKFQTLYVEVAVPRTAAPGRYTGELVVRAGRDAGTVPIAIDVAAVELPREATLRTWFLVWDDRADRIERARLHDRYHALLRKEGIGDGTAASVDRAVGIDVLPTVDAAAERVAADARALRAQRPGATLYSYEFDEPSDDRDRAAAAAWGRALAAAVPGVRQLVTAPPWNGLQPGVVGTFAVHLRDAASALPRARALGADMWIYTSCCERVGDPTLLLDDSASANAAIAPATWLAGGQGILYWGVSAYHGNPWRVANTDPSGIANGDGVLLYPGRPVGRKGPVPSLRLKLFATGMQVVDLAALASQRGHGTEAHEILSSLVTHDSQAADGTAWDDAVRRLSALAGGD